jgi:hypothetical protein
MDKASGRLDVGCALCITKAALCKKWRLTKKAAAFFKKAAQKFFVMLGHGRCRRQCLWPRINKVFLLLFVHKK